MHWARRVRPWWALAVVIVSVLVVVPAMASRVRRDGPTTEVVVFRPDEVAAGAPAGAATCWPSLASPRPDAYRCNAASVVYDPCFATEVGGEVMCPLDPRRGDTVALRDPAVAAPRPVSPGPEVWLLALVDGPLCGAVTGTAPDADDPVRFVCDDGRFVSRIDQSRSRWSVELVDGAGAHTSGSVERAWR